MTSIDRSKLRDAFGSFLTGVTVVNAVNEDGVPVGFTANSFTSVSLDPPLLLVCPSENLSSYSVFQTCEKFSVNILSENQREIANLFSRSFDDRFAEVSWRQKIPGCPVFDDVSAYFCCSVFERVSAGDHMILVGKVEAFDFGQEPGLGFSNTGYFSLGLERRAGENPKGDQISRVGAVIEHNGRLLVQNTSAGLNFPLTDLSNENGPIAGLQAFMARLEVSANIGPVYSIFDDVEDGSRSTFYRCIAKDGHIPPGMEYASFNELQAADFENKALEDMCERYISERRNGVFGLYIGDSNRGDIHMSERPIIGQQTS